MAFTDNCDFYGAVHEEGVNLTIQHLMHQRPSLFNYATADLAANRETWCHDIPATPDVFKYHNPLFTIVNPLPIIGADSPPVDVGFIAQINNVKIDFHPGNVIGLPGELSPPLKPQRAALQFRVCGGVECPSDREIDRIPVVPPGPNKERQKNVPPVHLRGQIKCFCLDVFAVAHIQRLRIAGHDSLVGKLEAVDIVDIKPDELEDTIVCYVKTAVNMILREQLTMEITKIVPKFTLLSTTITLVPTPNPPILNNPAIEEDQVKAFISMM